MKTTDEFIDHLVKIEYVESTGTYGHYPFQLVTENEKGELTVAALCLGGDILGVYRTVKTLLTEGAVKAFLSVDFPAGHDIENDYVAVFTLIRNHSGDNLTCIAMPYDWVNGKQFTRITSGEMINTLKEQFTQYVLN